MAAEKEFSIRPMEQQDIDMIFEIDRKISAVERAFTYAEMIDGYIGGDIGASFVAETDGQVIGFALAAITYVPEQVTAARPSEGGLKQRLSGCRIVFAFEQVEERGAFPVELVEALVDNCRSRGLKLIRIMADQHDSQLQGLFESLDFRRGRLIDYSKIL